MPQGRQAGEEEGGIEECDWMKSRQPTERCRAWFQGGGRGRRRQGARWGRPCRYCVRGRLGDSPARWRGQRWPREAQRRLQKVQTSMRTPMGARGRSRRWEEGRGRPGVTRVRGTGGCPSDACDATWRQQTWVWSSNRRRSGLWERA